MLGFDLQPDGGGRDRQLDSGLGGDQPVADPQAGWGSARGMDSQGSVDLVNEIHHDHASSHVPSVEAREYSVERFSKKFVCSTAISISSSQGSGFFSMW